MKILKFWDGRTMNFYEKGDKVLIVPKRVRGFNSGGEMDKYLNTVMTIDEVLGFGYHMKEDNGSWCWTFEMISDSSSPITSAQRDELNNIFGTSF